MTSALRISVVIPCRNDAEFLRKCLLALQKQERPADRIIVVDNGSTDESAAVAREAGVEAICYDTSITTEAISVRRQLPVVWP